MDSGLSFNGTVEQLHSAIREHYDELIDLYEDLWGEHIHHGYWEPGAPGTHRHAAQERTVRELVAFGDVRQGERILDAGCGIGASSVFLARELGCLVEGITLSDAQVARARTKAAAAGLEARARFRNADALEMPYPEHSFDVVWALESCELMPDKEAFLRECFRVLRPGGRMVVATWCSRDRRPSEVEARLLRRIYRDFAVAYVLPMEDYRSLCAAAGFEDLRDADWTENTRATWNLSSEIIKPFVRNPSYIWRLVRQKGTDAFRFLNSVPLMKQAYDRGLMRYGVFRGTKPLAGKPET